MRLEKKRHLVFDVKRMLVKPNFSRIPTLVGNTKCMKPRCQVCDILDIRKKIQIPGTSSTIQPGIIVILVTLSIYSCVANVTLEITSERHQTDYD